MVLLKGRLSNKSSNEPKGKGLKESDLVPRVGLEPTTLSLEVSCSIQLSYQGLVRVGRIELPSRAWKACILATVLHPQRPDYNR